MKDKIAAIIFVLVILFIVAVAPIMVSIEIYNSINDKIREETNIVKLKCNTIAFEWVRDNCGRKKAMKYYNYLNGIK